METALNEVGVTEVDGPKSNPRVLEYLQKTHLPYVQENDRDYDWAQAAMKTDSTPWCAGFANWCLEENKVVGYSV